VAGAPDGVDAGVCRRRGLLRAGSTYFVMPSRRLVSFRTAAAVSVGCLSGDGKTLVTVDHGKINGYGNPTGDATVTIRNVDTGAKLQEFKSEQPVTSSSLSADGKTLLTVEHGKLQYGNPTGDATVTIRNAENGATLLGFKSEQAVASSSLSGDGKSLATVEHGKLHWWTGLPEGDATVTVHNVDTGTKLQEFTSEQAMTVSSLSGDGKTLVIVESEMGDGVTTSSSQPQRSTVIMRNTETGAELQMFAHDMPVTSSSLSGDGSTLVAVDHGKVRCGSGRPTGDATVTIRNVENGATLHEFKSDQPVTSLSLSGDGKTLLTVEHGNLDGNYFGMPVGDATVTIRNVENGATLHEFKSDQPVTPLSLSGDGKTLVTVAHGELFGNGRPKGDAIITIRNVDTGAKLQEFKSEQVVTSSSLFGDGKTLVAVEHAKTWNGRPAGDATVTIRNVDTGTQLQEFKSEQSVTSSSLSGDGKPLLTVEHGKQNPHTGLPEGDATVTRWETTERAFSGGHPGGE
jgi:Tol biopolymer transport system component